MTVDSETDNIFSALYGIRGKGGYKRTIFNVIQPPVKIRAITNDERTSQPVAILHREMRMIPIRAICSGTENSYRNELLMVMGHCVTKAGPSAQAVRF